MLEPLTQKRFDDMIAAKAQPKIIWTAEAIGKRVNVGVDFVSDTLAKLPNSPVRKMGGRYYAYSDELEAFFRNYREEP